MWIFGTEYDDYISVQDNNDYFGMAGNDHFILNTDKNVKIYGGLGCDVFEFQTSSDQTVEIVDDDDGRQAVKIFENGERVQKIVLFDVEQIDWFMVG